MILFAAAPLLIAASLPPAEVTVAPVTVHAEVEVPVAAIARGGHFGGHGGYAHGGYGGHAYFPHAYGYGRGWIAPHFYYGPRGRVWIPGRWR